MKKTITFPCLKRCWLPVVLALFCSLNLVAQEPCNLVCNDHVNASMPADACERSFVPDDFLENPDPLCGTYAVQLVYPFGTNRLSGDTMVDRSHLGYTFIYRVIETSTQNSCWGYITIEDKAAPQPLCKNVKVSCFQVARLTEIVGDVIDNCGQKGSSAIERLNWTEYGCNDVRGLGRVIRSIRSWDEWGNSSTCTDTLTIGRDSLVNVKCPDPILLSCRVACKKVGNTGSNTNIANFDIIQLEANEFLANGSKNPKYPSPDLLLKLQARDTFGPLNKCIRADLKVVPFISDSVLVALLDTCFLVDSCVAMYPAPGGFCKTTLTWKDQVIPVCGTGFKIRREWLIADWCTGEDTVCVQYIKIEDKEKPVVLPTSKFIYNVSTGAHNCIADVTLEALKIDDCDINTKQNYIVTYDIGGHSGQVNILSGLLPAKIKLPAIVSNYGGQVTHRVAVSIVDGCLNRTDTAIYVNVIDLTPPSPVCDELTQTTVDPSTCWARVYAVDLDNGSKDNCCSVLHFAVAHMDSITFYTNQWVNYLNANCKANYWKYKPIYDGFISEYINCFVFKDYIDLSDCGTNQVVLRVYEACGVPRYDPHTFPCSKHDWFTYNTYGLCRAWHNFTFFNETYAKAADFTNCSAKFGPNCFEIVDGLKSPANTTTAKSINDTYLNYFFAKTSGGSKIALDLSPRYYGAETFNQSCIFSDGTTADSRVGGYAPGNTCSARRYNDCMVTILVDDKTLPVCVDPLDKIAFCDGVIGGDYEYADDACDDDSYTVDNFQDNNTCRDRLDAPYNAIECVTENDGSLIDTLDGTGVKSFGWYGCSIYGPAHQDEHGPIIDPCTSNRDSWSPIYCHTWLCTDKTDRAGKFNATALFDSAVARQGNPGAGVAGTGRFYIWDNCTAPTITKVDEIKIDNCGNGWLKRTWTAKDKCNNTIICDQKIIVKHRSDFEVEFPQDLTITCSTTANIDPKITGSPIIMDDECELVGVNYEDVRYDIVPDACYKIVRTWKLIDWCKYDPNAHNRDGEVIVDDRKIADVLNRYCVYRHLKDDGDGYISYTQIIKVIDTAAPVITVKDTTVCLFSGTDADCTAPNLAILFNATDNCTDAKQISFRWEIDLNASSSARASRVYTKALIDDKSGPNVSSFASKTIKDGTHLVFVIAEDNCGNEDTTSFLLTVKDCKKPTPYCFNGIATVLMPSTGQITVWASDLNAGSYDNCTAKSSLIYSFDKNGAITSDTFTCADIPNGISATIEVDIYVWDLAGNSDFCRTYLLIQDGNGNRCSDNAGAAAIITGRVTTEQTEAVEKVALNIQGSFNQPTYLTDNKGQYAFKGLPMKENYTITPKRDDDPMNGVSTIDLVLIQKHILGVQPFKSAYKYVAADADRNNDLTVLDLVELRKLILTVYDKLPNNTSWRFIPKSFDFSKISNPLQVTFPEQLNITQLSKDELDKDFVGIKIGDVNATSAPHSLLGAEAREASGALRFKAADRELKSGEETTVSFTSDNFNNIEGYQFSMAVNGLTITDIKPGALHVNENNFGLSKLNLGYLTTSWSEINTTSIASTIRKGEILFSIKVKATKDVRLSESLRINSKYTRAEAYAAQGGESKVLNVILEIGSSSNTQASNVLYQNTPNPFKSETSIGFDLAKSEKATINVSDVTGKIIRSFKVDGHKGANRLVLQRADFGGAGVLYYTIETKSFTDTKKMLLVE